MKTTIINRLEQQSVKKARNDIDIPERLKNKNMKYYKSVMVRSIDAFKENNITGRDFIETPLDTDYL